jgi:dolichyl-phosphate beta-glucosyltransferase
MYTTRFLLKKLYNSDVMTNSFPLLSVVIPAYNEAERILPTLASIFSVLEEKALDAEVIIVDDGSKDSMQESIKARFGDKKNLKIIGLAKNMGKGYAVKKGFESASGSYILFMDADGSVSIEELPKLMARSVESDVVIGIRTASKKLKAPLHRRIISVLGQICIRVLTNIQISDTQCGFKLFKAVAAKEISKNMTIDRFGFDVEVLYLAQKAGYKIVEVPVLWQFRAGSKLRSSRDSLGTLLEVMKIRMRMMREG